uniref:Uncharacterized protein n=1 Tax=Arundo donax TaxID=35708 RepID=A0A0A9GQJ0_ARUDO
MHLLIDERLLSTCLNFADGYVVSNSPLFCYEVCTHLFKIVVCMTLFL